MTERPILFSAPMVRAILESRKTMTRRGIKLPTKGVYEHPKMGGWAPTTLGGTDGSFRIIKGQRVPTTEAVCIWHQTNGICIAMPHQVGDRLWVREAMKFDADDYCCWAADMKRIPEVPADYKFTRSSMPSMFMPRWASRITLEVTAVKVERLQDISDDDAKAEGIFYQQPTAEDLEWFKSWQEENFRDPNEQMEGVWTSGQKDTWGPTPQSAFMMLWRSINGADSWKENPWVAAYSFKRVTP